MAPVRPGSQARNGHAEPERPAGLLSKGPRQATDLGFRVGAGEGNRTLMTSLEDRWWDIARVRRDALAGFSAVMPVNDRGSVPASVACGPCVARDDRPLRQLRPVRR